MLQRFEDAVNLFIDDQSSGLFVGVNLVWLNLGHSEHFAVGKFPVLKSSLKEGENVIGSQL